jgi:signal transduction histidine kinase
VSNALKYGIRADADISPRVMLGFDEANAEDDAPMIRFWCRDHGPGLAIDAQSQLFVEFTRLEQTRAQGHGLGLSIVQRIINKLGGDVGVESEIGHGSKFWFTLPRTE